MSDLEDELNDELEDGEGEQPTPATGKGSKRKAVQEFFDDAADEDEDDEEEEEEAEERVCLLACMGMLGV